MWGGGFGRVCGGVQTVVLVGTGFWTGWCVGIGHWQCMWLTDNYFAVK